MVFLAYAGASLAWAPSVNLWALANLVACAFAYYIGFAWPRQHPLYDWFIYFALAQFIAGLFLGINPNIIACCLALAFSLSLSQHRSTLALFCLAPLLLTGSRGAILSAGGTGVVWLWRRRPVLAMALLAIVLAAVVIHSSGRSESLILRVEVWQDTILSLTPFGHGLGSFYESFWTIPHVSMIFARPYHAYNDGLELLYEFGIGTVPLWLMLITLFDGPRRQDHLPCLTFLLLGLSFFPLFIFPCGQLFFLTLGHLAHMRHPYGSLETYRCTLSERSWNRVRV